VHSVFRKSIPYAHRALAVVALLSIAISSAWAEEQTVVVEVNYLINAVSESGCNFVRNGKEHTSSEAVDHLQMKARRGKRYYDTADEFIDRIASKSSWSGKPYQIQCDGQPAVTAADWFTRVLTEYRSSSEEA
jgi:hypothetical protein